MLLLEVNDLTKSFGGVVAVKNCSLGLEENTVCGLIGPNGSGKTTLFNLITGFLKPDGGTIMYRGDPIVGLKPRQIAQKGIVRTFQLTRIFPKMTVLENLLAASSLSASEAIKRSRELLKLTELDELEDEEARNLSHGQKKQLEFARMLMMKSDLILLDEPMAGLTHSMIQRMVSNVNYAKSQGKTVLIIEHNLPLIMNLCEKIFVLENGLKISEGTPEQVRKDAKVIEAYIGES